MKLSESRLFRQQALIGGDWGDAIDRRTISVRNPSTGSEIGTSPRLTARETQNAIEAARDAFQPWRRRPAQERAKILRRWAALMHAHIEDLATIITTEQGKPLPESRSEIAYAASYVEWFAEEAGRIYGETVPAKQGDRRHFVLQEPVGICAAITPWNFPAAMITRKAAPALAAGCVMIVKPAEQTPFTALALGALALEAGVPRGVLSVLTGYGNEIGPALTADRLVRKVSFTGSTEVGRLLMQQCAASVKRLSLELGGNAPFIVFDDADIDAAVAGLIASKFRNGGQTCVCANRVLVQSRVHDEFVSRLVAAAARLRVGDGFSADVELGPLIDQAAVAHVESLVADAVALGGRVLVGGRRHARGETFYEPTVIAGADARMRLAREEIFGPLAPVFKFDSEAEAVSLANDTEAGLAAYFYTRELARVWRIADAIECGMIGINTGIISSETIPFGGVKQSGFGREGSRHGIDEYLSLKAVTLAGL